MSDTYPEIVSHERRGCLVRAILRFEDGHEGPADFMPEDFELEQLKRKLVSAGASVEDIEDFADRIRSAALDDGAFAEKIHS